MSAVVRHQVRARVAGTDRSSLLTLLAAIHARGVEVREAHFGPTEREEVRELRAVFDAEASRATTLAATLGELIDVVAVSLESGPDPR
ncbi:hypothetical protein [Nocardioides daeguensis]|uniref:ACT domain-containing protein n=1 Tax=Nocardioides daeguensis TaxID=908359 RepID=A0ABP6V027_9ACTN|nr:hypothetical protein [Nocardioides daeguensis]MBV6727208.1 hypothetical protein [Nocardioides daeguensis]MCR1771222.1 hypothetical protein [Nocardioides daeguensis]